MKIVTCAFAEKNIRAQSDYGGFTIYRKCTQEEHEL